MAAGQGEHHLKRYLKIFALCIILMSLCQVLWNLSGRFFMQQQERQIKQQERQSRNYISTLFVESRDNASDTYKVRVDTVKGYKPLIVNDARVEISGRAEPFSEIELSINERQHERHAKSSDGRFTFYDLMLGRGLNKLRFSNPAKQSSFSEYEVILQKIPAQDPIVVASQFDAKRRQLNIIGVGEPNYVYRVNFGDVSNRIGCDQWGTFLVSINITKSDSIGYFLRNTAKDTIGNFAVSVQNGQYAVKTPIALARTTEVFVDSAASRLRARLSVQMSTRSTLYENLASGLITPRDFANAVFGYFGWQWTIALPEISVGSNCAKIVLEGQTAAYWPGRQFDFVSGFGSMSSMPLFSDLDSLIIHFPKVIDYASTVSPDDYVGDSKIWIGPRSSLPKCNFFRPTSVPETAATSREKETQKIPKNIKELFFEFAPTLFEKNAFAKIFDNISWAIFSAIPLLWLFFVARRHGERLGDFQKTLVAVLALLIFFHFTYHILFIGRDFISWINTPIDTLDKVQDWRLGEWYIPGYNNLSKLLWVGILLFFPIALNLTSQPQLNNPQGSVRQKFLLIVCFFVIAAVFGYMSVAYFQSLPQPGSWPPIPFSAFKYYIWMSISTKYYTWMGISTVIALVIFYILAILLDKILLHALHIHLPANKIHIALLVMLSLSVAFDALQLNSFEMNKIAPYLWAAVCGSFGALWLYRGINVTFWLRSRPVPDFEKWLKVLLLVVFVLIAFPKKILFEEASIFVDFTLFSFFFRQVIRLFPFLGLFAIIVMLYKDSLALGFKLDRLALKWGLLLFSFFIVESGFGYGYRWMWIPITIIIAYALAKKYLFAAPEIAVAQLEKNGPPLRDRQTSIQKIVSFLAYKRYFKDSKKRLDKKLSESEINYSEWKQKVEENKATLDQLRNESMHEGNRLEHIVFSHGIAASPWENALMAVRAGAWLSVLWILVFIRDFRTWNINTVYPLLSWADEFLYNVLVWFIIAFLFGYYYHMLRGRNGIEKAWWLSLIIIVARIGPAVIFADSPPIEGSPGWGLESLIAQFKKWEIWELFIWGVKVLVYCLLLGFFAFDYRIIRKNGFGWPEIVLMYNLVILSTYGSTLLAALAGILSGQLQDLFKTWLPAVLGIKP